MLDTSGSGPGVWTGVGERIIELTGFVKTGAMGCCANGGIVIACPGGDATAVETAGLPPKVGPRWDARKGVAGTFDEGRAGAGGSVGAVPNPAWLVVGEICFGVPEGRKGESSDRPGTGTCGNGRIGDGGLTIAGNGNWPPSVAPSDGSCSEGAMPDGTVPGTASDGTVEGPPRPWRTGDKTCSVI
jgi:hypothetical protein